MTKPRKSKRKTLTKALASKIVSRRKLGETYEIIRSALGVSDGLITKALKRAETSDASTETTPSVAESALATPEGDLLALDELSRAARRDGNLQGVAMFERLKIAARAEQRKNKSTETPEGFYVTHAEMQAAADRVRKRWHDLIDKVQQVEG